MCVIYEEGRFGGVASNRSGNHSSSGRMEIDSGVQNCPTAWFLRSSGCTHLSYAHWRTQKPTRVSMHTKANNGLNSTPTSVHDAFKMFPTWESSGWERPGWDRPICDRLGCDNPGWLMGWLIDMLPWVRTPWDRDWDASYMEKIQKKRKKTWFMNFLLFNISVFLPLFFSPTTTNKFEDP